MIGTPSELASVVSLLVVVIAAVLLKALSGRGTPLHGGFISGHAAIAFSIATTVTLNTQDPLTSVLVIALAIMVSHSRLLMRIHTLRELLLGAVSGCSVTLAVTLLFRYFG
jgi:diacylglycerol kinase (ATP)